MLYFAVFYLAMTALAATVSVLFELQVPGYVSLIMTMLGGIAVGSRFFRDQGRVPEPSERRKLALAGVAGGMGISLMPLVILFIYSDPSLQPFRDMLGTGAGVAILSGSALLVLVVCWLFIDLGIRQGAKAQSNYENGKRGRL